VRLLLLLLLVAAPPRPFVLYDNTFYTNVNLGAYGLIKSNVLYEPPELAQTLAAGRLPDQAAFMTLVSSHAQQPGPLVLDFENLYLKGKPDVALLHATLLTVLLQWAHDALPGRAIGCYGLLDNTDPAYVALAAKVAALQDALFPSAYTFDGDLAGWRRRLAAVVALGRRIAPGKPVYPYLWPQYHEGTAQDAAYLSGAQWTYELRTAAQLADGAVIWSKQVANGDEAWVRATASFTGH